VPNRVRRPPRERLNGGLEISRLPTLPSILSFPFFFNPVWVLCLLNALEGCKRFPACSFGVHLNLTEFRPLSRHEV